MTYKLIDYEGFEAYAKGVRDKYAIKKDIITNDERRQLQFIHDEHIRMTTFELEGLFYGSVASICGNKTTDVSPVLWNFAIWIMENDYQFDKILSSEQYKTFGFTGVWQKIMENAPKCLFKLDNGSIPTPEELGKVVKKLSQSFWIWVHKPIVDELNRHTSAGLALQISDSKFVHKDGIKTLSTNDYTNEDKAKVDAIPSNPKYTDTIPDLTPYAKKENIPTKLSQLTNDKTFKTESEIQQMIEKASSLKKEVVTSLPTTGKDDVIYLVKDPKGEDNNNYLEYLWLNGKYELIGSTQVDLSGYAQIDELTQYENAIYALQNDMREANETLNKKQDTIKWGNGIYEGNHGEICAYQYNDAPIKQRLLQVEGYKLDANDIQEFTQQELEEAFK